MAQRQHQFDVDFCSELTLQAVSFEKVLNRLVVMKGLLQLRFFRWNQVV